MICAGSAASRHRLVCGVLALVAGLVTLVGAGTAVVLTAAPASAHDVLVSASPADGSTVAVLPDEVVLTFDQPALKVGSQLVVEGPAGPVQVGEPSFVDTSVRQRLAPGSPPGAYRVLWRVTSVDGHPISGTFAFTATAGSAGSTGSGSAATGSASPTPPASEAVDTQESGPAWVVPVLGVLVVVVAAAVVVVVRRRRHST